MISSALLFVLAVRATQSALVPTAPGPGHTYKTGGDCPMSWNLDTTNKWTSFNVDLMSGSNQAMQFVANVFTGHNGTVGETTFTWPCPQVTPNSAIYFYQFTQAGADTTWTTRFAIASSTGQVTPPVNSNQPDGAPIPWGVGHLAGASSSNQDASNATSVTPSLSSPSPANASLTTTNTTNTTMPVAAASNATVPIANTSNTTSSGKNSSPTSASNSKRPTSTNTASTSQNSPAPPSSSSSSLLSSNSGMAALALVTLFTLA